MSLHSLKPVVLAIALGVGFIPAQAGAQKVVYRIDFSHQPDGDASDWLKKQGFDFELDADALNPHFEDHRLVLETDGENAGFFVSELRLPDAKRIRVTWGVDRYPEGADWSKGVYRVPIAVVISFGEKKIDSGSFFVPDAPYFISLFLGKKEQEGRAYTANYYRKGGRYFCTPCNAPTEETVTTEFDLSEAFQAQFDVTPTPPVTSFGFQMNTDDTEGGARAFLKTVEFLSE